MPERSIPRTLPEQAQGPVDENVVRAQRAEIREAGQAARAEGAERYAASSFVDGASDLDSLPEEMTAALHRAGLLGRRITRAEAETALEQFRTTEVTC